MLLITAIIFCCISVQIHLIDSKSRLSHEKDVFCFENSNFNDVLTLKLDEIVTKYCSHIILSGFCFDPLTKEIHETRGFPEKNGISQDTDVKLRKLKSDESTEDLLTIIKLPTCLFSNTEITNVTQDVPAEDNLIEFLKEYDLNGMLISDETRFNLNPKSIHEDSDRLYDSFYRNGFLLIGEDPNCLPNNTNAYEADYFISNCNHDVIGSVNCRADEPSKNDNGFIVDKLKVIYSLHVMVQTYNDSIISFSTYGDICNKIVSQDLTVVNTKYCFKEAKDINGTSIKFIDPETIIKAMPRIISHGYEAFMIADFNNDDINGDCSKSNEFSFPYGITGKRPLLQAVNQGILNALKSPHSNRIEYSKRTNSQKDTDIQRNENEINWESLVSSSHYLNSFPMMLIIIVGICIIN